MVEVGFFAHKEIVRTMMMGRRRRRRRECQLVGSLGRTKMTGLKMRIELDCYSDVFVFASD